MTQVLNITAAIHSDIPQLVQMINSAYRGESSKQGWTTEADLMDGIRTDHAAITELMNKPDAIFFKCYNDTGIILGSVFLEKKDHRLYLGMLTVSPELQGGGIGKRLLKAAEEYGKQKGFYSIIMTVISVRKELVDWYERHGYKRTGQTEPFPVHPHFGAAKQPLEFLILEKVLQ